MQIRNPSFRRGLALSAAITWSFATHTFAIELLVYNNNDSGPGSLRQAVQDNNGFGGGNTIIFSNIVAGTIKLTTGELFISNNVTILGPGANVLAINGNASNRVFRFESMTGSLSGLTITNGKANDGGGIYNYRGNLTVSNCTLSGNSGGGSQSGGAIYNDGLGGSATLTLIASTLSGNSAGYGGAIFNDGEFSGSATLTVSNCTLSGNSVSAEGGGIYNDAYGGSAPLKVIASMLSSNSAFYGGGIFNLSLGTNAPLTVSGSTLSGNSATSEGGGIYNDHGPLTLIASTLSSNSSVFGGGIFNDGENFSSAPLTVSNCTFSGNSATSDGGGIFNDAYQGSAPLRVVASTFSGNSAFYGGGICNLGFGTNAPLTVSGSTLSSNSAPNGGGIFNSGGTVTIGNTIFKAGALGANFTNDVFGTITSQGYNLSSDHGSGYLTATGDQINTDALLGPLANNGGPTRTHMPLAGSLAIDQGKGLGLTRDQLGRCRTFDDAGIPNATGGDGTDIGAVEVGAVPTTVVATNVDSGVSLRYCICEAQPGDTVTFASSVTGTVALMSGELLINKDLTLQGPGAKLLAISGHAASRVFHTSNSVVTLFGLTITDGSTGGAGGGIYNDHSTLTVSKCILSGNSAVNGGGIFNAGGDSGSATLTVIASTLNSNSAVYGGGIYNDGYDGSATLTVSASTLSGNTADAGLGGGIYNTGNATLTVSACTLNSNSAGDGGGIYNYKVNAGNVALTVIRNTILKAGASGANLYNNGGTLTSDGHNFSSDNGGGFLTATGDQINTDPTLGPLADNGGPTLTHALLPGSPAIDKGKSLGTTIDQRGEPRSFDFSSITNAAGGDGSDIGAFEVGRPKLSIQQVGSSAVLSWLAYSGEFVLQSSTNVTSSNSWTTAGGSATIVGNQYQQTNGPISSNRFFRLRGN